MPYAGISGRARARMVQRGELPPFLAHPQAGWQTVCCGRALHDRGAAVAVAHLGFAGVAGDNLFPLNTTKLGTKPDRDTSIRVLALIIKFAARRRGVARQCLHTGGDIFVTGTDQCGTGIEELLTHGLHAVRDAAGHWGRIAEDCLQRTAHVIVDMCTDLKILSRSWNRTESSLNAARSLVDVISIHLEFAM